MNNVYLRQMNNVYLMAIEEVDRGNSAASSATTVSGGIPLTVKAVPCQYHQTEWALGKWGRLTKMAREREPHVIPCVMRPAL